MHDEASTRPFATVRFSRRLAIALAVVVAWGILMWPTLLSLARLWSAGGTYAHGWLIGPISAWLVWRQRAHLRRIPIKPDALAIAGVIPCCATWMLARAVDVAVVEQAAAVLLLPLLVWGVLGRKLARAIAFPLAFLVFAVPFGEALVPWLTQFTADFTVHALRLSGVPVFREGFYFTTSGGQFLVAKACSGVRYLSASLATGTLFAWLAYHSWRRRAAFIACAFVVPIIANGIRAYGIVMIAHLSNMRIAVGIDHIIYGWLFFGLVMLLMFYVGNKFRDPAPVTGGAGEERDSEAAAPVHRSWQPAISLLLYVALVSLFVAVDQRDSRAQLALSNDAGARCLPAGIASWSGPEAIADPWEPAYQGAVARMRGRYVDGPRGVDLHVAVYGRRPRPGSELISDENRIFGGNTQLVPQERVVEVGAGNSSMTARLAGAPPSVGPRWVLYWFLIDGVSVANPYEGKARQAWALLHGVTTNSALVAVSANERSEEVALQTLSDFVSVQRDAVVRAAADNFGCGPGGR
ncbi:MAG TPA: exosortase A [Steroidobacteraceae bacterium]|nr:exosortase A [Steroidobacteraceae bacterium]